LIGSIYQLETAFFLPLDIRDTNVMITRDCISLSIQKRASKTVQNMLFYCYRT